MWYIRAGVRALLQSMTECEYRGDIARGAVPGGSRSHYESE
jgi:hypothetical protein